MSQLGDLYNDHTIDDDFHIEPYDFNDVQHYDYEPDTTYYDYAAPRPYDDWNDEDERVIERSSYTVPKVPFYGETTNRSQYTWKDPVFNKPRTSSEPHVDRSNPPFYSETTNRTVYSPKALKRTVERNQSEEDVERPRIPFYSETTNRSDYVEKVVTKAAPLRKPASKPSPQIPFDLETTNTSEFTLKRHAKRNRRSRQEERVDSVGEDYDASYDIVFEDN